MRRSWGWATAEMFAINFGASMFNEYVRDANFNQISPRSFWANLEEGFTYDDNEFKTNQLIHPFNGATYYNAARANGIGFWGSSAMSIAGAFVWECCGETHPMSFNDMVSTGIGGIARGEVSYRVSSLILDNTKRGKGRFGREAAALLIDPIRGFNRLVTGDATEVKGNPADRWDWRPDFQLAVRAGGPRDGRGRVDLGEHEHLRLHGVGAQLRRPLGRQGPPALRPLRRPGAVELRRQDPHGAPAHPGRPLHEAARGRDEAPLLTLQQDFDYIDNEAYEYGGPEPRPGPPLAVRPSSSAPLLHAASRPTGSCSGASTPTTRSSPKWPTRSVSGSTTTARDWGSGRAVPPAEEPPPPHRPLSLQLHRRFERLDLQRHLRGQEVGLDSDHDVHQANLKLEIPITRSLTVGADGSVFFRRSRYNVTVDTPEFGPPRRQTITQRNPEARLFLAWTYNH